MEIFVRKIGDACVVELIGVTGAKDVGRLYDALVAAAGDGAGGMILDLSGLAHMGRSTTRGVFVAAKLLCRHGGRLRICGANPSVAQLLKGIGIRHLLAFDATRAASLAALGAPVLRPRAAGAGGRAPTQAPPPSFVLFLEVLRVEYARFLIDERGGPVDRIAAACGYEDPEALRCDFQKHLGVAPGDYAARTPRPSRPVLSLARS